MAEQGITRKSGESPVRLGPTGAVRGLRRTSTLIASAVLLALGYGTVSVFGAASSRPAPMLVWSVGDPTQSVLAACCLIALACLGTFATTRPRARIAGWLILSAWLALTCCLGSGAVLAGAASAQDAAARVSHLAAALAIAFAALAPHALVAGTLRDRRAITAMLCCSAGLAGVAVSYLSHPGAVGVLASRAYADPFGFGDLVRASGPHNGLAGAGCLGTVLLLGCLAHGVVSALRALRTWRGPADEPLLLLVAVTLVGGVLASTLVVAAANWWSDGRRVAAVYAGALLTLAVGAAVWHGRIHVVAAADRLGGSVAAVAMRRLLVRCVASSSRFADWARDSCLDHLAPPSGQRADEAPRCSCGQYRAASPHPRPSSGVFTPVVISEVDGMSDMN